MIIKSIIDTDLYKLTMQQAVMQKFPYAKAKFKFINRGSHKFTKPMVDEIVKNIHEMADLQLTPGEANFLKEKCEFLTPVYIDFLRGYRFNPKEVKFNISQKGTDILDFGITITGPWYRTILWEVPIMAIISEVWTRHNFGEVHLNSETRNKHQEKFRMMRRENVPVADFGTRRRASRGMQEWIANLGSGFENFVGTSNVMFAYMYDVKPIGTHAHEWFMFHGAKYGYKEANRLALRNWADVYHGNLGVALTDTYGTDAFFKSFGSKYARLFDGVRHDSGNPIRFATRVIAHYHSLGIDPMTKTIVFSDGLDPEKAVEIAEHCQDKIKCSFGIGTNLTNDIGNTPMNIVIKMTACKPYGEDEWQPTVKLSDVPGKHTGDKEEIELCKKSLRI